MKKIVDALKQIRFVQVVAVFCAGVILLVTTACSPPTPRVSGEGSYNERVSEQTDLYRPIEEKQGGMNNYADTDPRRDTTQPAQKARALSQNAERNIQKVQNAEEFAKDYRSGTPLGERVRNIGEGLGKSVEDVQEGVTQGTKEGSRNLGNNLQKAGRGASETVDTAREQAAGSARSLAKDTQRATDASKDRAAGRA